MFIPDIEKLIDEAAAELAQAAKDNNPLQQMFCAGKIDAYRKTIEIERQIQVRSHTYMRDSLYGKGQKRNMEVTAR